MKEALIVVDVQQGFVSRHAYNIINTISNINELINISLNKGIEIIYIKHSGSIFNNSIEEALASELFVVEKGIVIEKKYASAFYQTELDTYLKNKDIKTIIIAGLRTECCVDLTCHDGHDLGYNIVIPKDCNSTIDRDGSNAKETHHFYNNIVFPTTYKVLNSYKELVENTVKDTILSK